MAVAKKRKTTVTRTSARRCSCSVGELGRLRPKRKTAKKTTRKTAKTGCKLIHIRGRGVRKGCYDSQGRWGFVKR